jgi:hypothetical protein
MISDGRRDRIATTNQRTIKKLAAVFDQGNEAKAAIARPSAIGARRRRKGLDKEFIG